jgi:hypothetical protein
MAAQFETLHIHTTDAAAVRAAVATAANDRKERVWRMRLAVAKGWTSLYPELQYDPQAFARSMSSATGALTVQVAGRDGLFWAVHVAKAGKTLALFRSDQISASSITATVEALTGGLASAGDRAALSDLFAETSGKKSDKHSGKHSDQYLRLCALLGVSKPRLSFSDASDLELLEFQLSQAEPGPAPVEGTNSPIDYSLQ